MSSHRLTIADAQQLGLLYYVAASNIAQSGNNATPITFTAPDANGVLLNSLSDWNFCTSVKNTLDPSGKPGRAHSMEYFLLLYSSYEFALSRAEEVNGMKVFAINPRELVSLGQSPPALYRLEDLVNAFKRTHLVEFRNHWEGEHYIDEAGCFLAFHRIVGEYRDPSVANPPNNNANQPGSNANQPGHNNQQPQPQQLPIIRKIPETEYPFAQPKFVKGRKPLGQFYCSKARHYTDASHFPVNPTTTNGRSSTCYIHQSAAWKANNPNWARDANV